MLYFGSPFAVYVLLFIGLLSIVFITTLAWKSTYGKGTIVFYILRTASLAFVLSWIWIGYTFGYRLIHGFKVVDSDHIIVRYAWPKSDVTIEASKIREIGVYRFYRPHGRAPSPMLEIELFDGRVIGSCAPLPEQETLEEELRKLPMSRIVGGLNEWTRYTLLQKTAEIEQ
jgi:hypothetical protein